MSFLKETKFWEFYSKFIILRVYQTHHVFENLSIHQIHPIQELIKIHHVFENSSFLRVYQNSSCFWEFPKIHHLLRISIKIHHHLRINKFIPLQLTNYPSVKLSLTDKFILLQIVINIIILRICKIHYVWDFIKIHQFLI